jgi:hypothetical protein
MFSVSCITNSGNDARASVEAALAHVADDSFCAMVENAPEDWRADCGTSEWLQGTVVFRGDLEGVVTCRLPRALAVDCAGAFLGVTEDALTEQVVTDMVGELSNMVCGRWLSRAFPSHLCQLARPETTVVSEPPSGEWLVMWMNGYPFGLSIAITHGVS